MTKVICYFFRIPAYSSRSYGAPGRNYFMNKNLKLRRLLSYKNPEVVARFCKENAIPKKEAEIVFKDMLRFLWLSWLAHSWKNKPSIPKVQVGMGDSFFVVDEMWHTFVLYTKEYAEFSERYFGYFMHHDPKPTLQSEKKGQISKNKEVSWEVKRERLIEFVWNELGPTVARRWFKIYPEKYSKLKIKKNQVRALKLRSS